MIEKYIQGEVQATWSRKNYVLAGKNFILLIEEKRILILNRVDWLLY